MTMNNKQAADIAITAAEGGIGYWSQIDNTIRPYPFPEQDDYPDWYVFYTIVEQDDNGDYVGSRFDITTETIK
jgi:hypothetical protein